MAAKELKALVEIGASLGYTGDELKQFISEERMRMDREKEGKEEKERVEKEKQREFELEKMKLEQVEKEKQIEKEFELEKMKLVQLEKEKEAEKERELAEKEREIQLEKLKYEEREKERADAEREKERRYELERIRLEKEVEVQRICSEHEIRTTELNRQNEGNGDVNGNQGGNGQNNRGRSVAMKALKLPPFNEDKDDLDAYLTRFERACTAFDVEPEYWSTQLARLLQGKSLDVYQRLTDAEVGDYQVLKAQLLKRFRLTEGGYRRKFKTSKLEMGETPEQFVERLRRYLIKWREMAGYDATYEGLENMILRDQYFLTCDKSLKTFLKEKRKLNLKEMTKAITRHTVILAIIVKTKSTKQSCLIKTKQTLDPTVQVGLQFQQDYTVIIVV